MYLNRATKERMVSLLILEVICHEFIQQESKFKEIFGPEGWKYFKTSKSFMKKALVELSKSLGEEEATKLHNLARQSQFVAVSHFAPDKNMPSTIGVDVHALYDMASLAIGNHCTDCTKKKFKQCEVFQTMQQAEVPAASNAKDKDCPYRQ
ncbi:DUF5651 domain-containing protein [Ammoniphilus sp. YIM 78166]|uniref:DUF5651 domain-containing protein n=1 Tax=Ammoniphilus sp. YIM 78166 TaxID=1644106 RepID=UPI00106FE9D1|nr:DUF5651 domain-containing protein [Ammoniphilus sp. YIM 78166]